MNVKTQTSRSEHESANSAGFAASLVHSGKLSEAAFERATRVAAETGEPLELVLPRLALLSERDLTDALAQFLGVPLLSPAGFPTAPVCAEKLGAQFLRERHALPIRERPDSLVLAMARPLDRYAADAVRFAVGKPVIIHAAYPSDIEAAFERLYGNGRDNVRRVVELASDRRQVRNDDDVERLKESASDAPVIRLINLLISRAVEARASDIHIEPGRSDLRVRYRIDGVLHPVETPPQHLASALLSRIKVMAKLNIAERRLPQDGRIATAVRGRDIDIRVAISPTIHGERATLRILDRNQLKLDFAELGFDDSVLQPLREVLAKPYGVLLVTGPTGSGKTTTLYTALSELNRDDTNILTIEDPIEYQLPGISQVQVKPQIGLTFASALRSFLRQDPDIMMVGEIRDLETAQIAVQAALTGHLILSTLHTNDAASTVTRLLEMGVEDYLITSTLNGVAAQRLVRTLCTDCREPYRPVPELIDRLDLPRAPDPRLYRPIGCSACNGTGYRGRSVIAEVLTMTDALRQAVLRNADASAIQALAAQAGMPTMRAHGLAKALAGQTSIEEVLRATKATG